ncbi:MAG: multicopper oxidase family protein [Pseudomonadota bacterium]
MGNKVELTRRRILQTGVGGGAACLASSAFATELNPERTITLRPRVHPKGWLTYGDNATQHPLRVRPHTPYKVIIENGLEVDTSVHWHGQRVVNAVDGVPGITQEPIKPGERYEQTVVFPDPGTHWYHPHLDSHATVGRGLVGALIVEEETPAPFDHDITALTSRHLVTQDGAIYPNFGELFNTRFPDGATWSWRINSAAAIPHTAAANAHIRLRLINASAMVPFTVEQPDIAALIIATDGHPVATPRALEGPLKIWPGQRYDLALKMPNRPIDLTTEEGFALASLHPSGTAAPETAAPRLPLNPLAKPNLAEAVTFPLTLTRDTQSFTESAIAAFNQLRGYADNRGADWRLNGVSLYEDALCGEGGPPLFVARKGETVRLNITNHSVNHHPMHIHGHSFYVVARGGVPVTSLDVHDTIDVESHSSTEIAFVADNPCRWMVHCHDLRHQMQGMMGYFVVEG